MSELTPTPATTPDAPAPTPAAAPAAPASASASASTPAPVGVATIKYDDFAKVQLRVAEVLEARPHPNADKLMLLQLQVGDERKQIVAGIKQHYTPEQLVGKKIVIVHNLEPAVIRGETSNGMLLAASSGSQVILVTVDDPACLSGSKIK